MLKKNTNRILRKYIAVATLMFFLASAQHSVASIGGQHLAVNQNNAGAAIKEECVESGLVSNGKEIQIKPKRITRIDVAEQGVSFGHLISHIKKKTKTMTKNEKKIFYTEHINDEEHRNNNACFSEEIKKSGIKPRRIDTLIKRQGAYRKQSTSELISNALDAILRKENETGDEHTHHTIGRFGIGAFQSLNELRDTGDQVVWTTSTDGKEAIRIVIEKGEEENEYHYHSSTVRQGVRKGTHVQVIKTEDFSDPDSYAKFIRDKFYLNYAAPIYLNGELINPLEEVTFINGGKLNYLSSMPVIISLHKNGYAITDTGSGMDAETVHEKLLMPYLGENTLSDDTEKTDEELAKEIKLFYRTHKIKDPYNKKVGSSIHFQVSGVIIESFELEGYYLPRDFVIELSPDTHLTQDRGQIQLTPMTLRSLSIVWKKMLDAKTEYRTELLNGFCAGFCGRSR